MQVDLRLSRALDERRPPTREVADGALVIIGGTLLLTPGFVTDVAGFFCLLPPTRPLARRLLLRAAGRRIGLRFGVPTSSRRRDRRREVIDGELIDDPLRKRGPDGRTPPQP